MSPLLRPLHPSEYRRFVARIVETAWADLPAFQRERLTQAAIAPAIEHVVEVLMAQGDNVILVADLPEQPNVGQVWLGEARDPYTGARRGYIYDLFVEPGARGQGIGRALLEAIEQSSRARGDSELGLTVAAHNTAAQALYHALGFQTERLNLSKPLER